VELLLHILVFVGGVVLLIASGDVLVRGAVALADRLGVPALVVGLTIVALGTSAPELALNLVAAFNGNDALSFGNIIGSNIANVGLIVGIAALITPLTVSASVVRRELPLMICATVATLAMAALPSLGRDDPSIAGSFSRIDGVVLLLGFVGSMALIVFWAKRAPKSEGAAVDQFTEEVAELRAKAREKSVWLAIAMVLAGLAGLALGGRLAEKGAVEIAQNLGMSNELIGLTIVAIATSLPELATVLMAMRRGQVDIAVGNVVGSNLFNLLLILGVTAAVGQVDVPVGGWIALGMMTALSIILVPMTRIGGAIVSRLEGAVLLLLYAGYLIWEVWIALA
jgi:cation:H+ antiporter